MARKLSLSVMNDSQGYREATLVADGADVDLLVEAYQKAIDFQLPEVQVPESEKVRSLEAEVARLTDLCRPMVGFTEPVGLVIGTPLMDRSDLQPQMSATDQDPLPGLPPSKLPERLAYLRKSRGLTETDLMAMTGLSYGAIAKAENNESVPRFTVLTNIAQAFGVSLDYLMGRSDETTVPSPRVSGKRRSQTVGERIKAERKRLGLTAVDLSSRIGVSASFVGLIKTGMANPSSVTALHMAHVLGVSIDYLACLTDEPGGRKAHQGA